MLSVEQIIRAAKDEDYRRSLNAEEREQLVQVEGLIALLQFVELAEQEITRTVR